MRIRQTLLSILFLCCFLPGVTMAQKEIRHYLKNDDTEVKKEKQADFIRVYQIPASEHELIPMLEYYPDGTIKRKGEVLRIARSPVFVGTMTAYYRNGQLKKEMFYPKRAKDENADHTPNTLVHYYDSLGNQLVVHGNGFVRELSVDLGYGSGEDYEEGEYRNGLREGEWTGKMNGLAYSFTEQYKAGVLSEGVTWDAEGKEYQYTVFEVQAQYEKGKYKGLDGFRQMVFDTFRLPKSASSAKGGINGVINVEYMINEKGEPEKFKIMNDLGHGTGSAVVTAIRLAGKWTPAHRRGIPVPSEYYTLPMRLKIAGTGGM